MSDHELRLTDTSDFTGLARALHKLGRRDLEKVLTTGMRAGAERLVPLIRAAARENLPHRGGLNVEKATAPIDVQSMAGSAPTVRIVMKNTQGSYAAGRIRHPVFEKDKAARKGAKERGDAPVPWVVQRVDGEWFDGTIVENAESVVLPAMDAAFDVVAEHIVREARR